MGRTRHRWYARGVDDPFRVVVFHDDCIRWRRPPSATLPPAILWQAFSLQSAGIFRIMTRKCGSAPAMPKAAPALRRKGVVRPSEASGRARPTWLGRVYRRQRTSSIPSGGVAERSAARSTATTWPGGLEKPGRTDRSKKSDETAESGVPYGSSYCNTTLRNLRVSTTSNRLKC